jgi:hydroxymethylbilane synthase
MRKLTIATRGSKLALWQANHIKAELTSLGEDVEVEIQTFVTRGDAIQDKPLALIGGKGLFTKEIDEAMLRGDAHIAVHSMKDLPVVLPEELQLCAITEREDIRDALLSEKYDGLDALPQGATVGTTSLRRRMNLYAERPDLNIVELRGNVDTRIRKLKEGEFDAIVLAAAGINRLELTDSVKYFTPIDVQFSIPSMGQGALALQTIKDPFVVDLVSKLNHKATMMEVVIERDFVGKLEGGCQVPIGISASVLGNGDILVKSIIGLPNGTDLLRQSEVIKETEYESAGARLADEMIARGAKEVLARASEIAYK